MIEVGLQKNIAYIILEKIMVLLVAIQRLNDCTVLQQLSTDKVVVIRFILASSVNFDMFDSIHSPEDVDHLVAERITYVKNQEVQNLADENSSSIDSQINVDYINHVIGELIDSVKDEKDTCLTQVSQENFDFIDGDDIPIELIEGKVDNYYIEHPITYARGEVDFQSIDKCEMVKLQDVPIEFAKEHKIEACTQEEVVSDMTLPEVYRVHTEIHTVVQLETPMIKLEEKCLTQSEQKLGGDMPLLCDTPTLPQTIAQPMPEQKVLLPDRALQGKLIPITHASWRETLRSESVRKETPTYTDSILF